MIPIYSPQQDEIPAAENKKTSVKKQRNKKHDKDKKESLIVTKVNPDEEDDKTL